MPNFEDAYYKDPETGVWVPFPYIKKTDSISSTDDIIDEARKDVVVDANYVHTDNNFTTEYKNASHAHANKSILDSIIQSVVDAWNGAVSWITNTGAPHVDNADIHLTSAEKTQGGLATGNTTLDTVKKVADKVTEISLNSADWQEIAPTPLAGYINKDTGAIVGDSTWKYVELPFDKYKFTTSVTNGSNVSIVSFFNLSGGFISNQIIGQSGTQTFTDQLITPPEGTYTIRVCTNASSSLYVYKSTPNSYTKDEIDAFLKADGSYLTISPTVTTGYYINKDTGAIVANALWQYIKLPVEDYKFSVTVNAGSVVAIVSFFDIYNKFLGTQFVGTISSDQVFDKQKINPVDHTAWIYICFNSNKTCKVYQNLYNPIDKNRALSYISPLLDYTPIEIHTWGDSITQAGKYQTGMATVFSNNTIKNFGLASDFSPHVRRRFISYYNDLSPFVGTANYTIPPLEERKNRIKDSFILIWMGTNNLINSTRTNGPFTTGSSTYLNIQPSPDFRYDRMISKSYNDMFLNDLRLMIDQIPHNNFAIITGHGGFSTASDMYSRMNKLDDIITDIYPRNVINIRKLAVMNYNYKNTYVTANFVKPALNSAVDITVNDGSWAKTLTSYICIGTKEVYDKYFVNSITGNVLNCTLTESSTEFASGDTILASYKLTSDLGRDWVDMPTMVYSYEDCVNFSLLSVARTASDPIHFTDAMYTTIGIMISKEIKKIITSFLI